MFYTEYVGVL